MWCPVLAVTSDFHAPPLRAALEVGDAVATGVSPGQLLPQRARIAAGANFDLLRRAQPQQPAACRVDS